MRTEEIWHDLDRFPSHQVSSHGRVRNKKTGRIDPMKGLRIAIAMNHTPVRIVELNKEFNSVRDCAEFLRVPPNHISRVLCGTRKGQRIHGYHIEYM